MILKIVAIFLVVIVVLASVGRLRLRLPGGRQVVKCPKCGRYIIGKGPCSCTSSRQK